MHRTNRAFRFSGLSLANGNPSAAENMSRLPDVISFFLFRIYGAELYAISWNFPLLVQKCFSILYLRCILAFSEEREDLRQMEYVTLTQYVTCTLCECSIPQFYTLKKYLSFLSTLPRILESTILRIVPLSMHPFFPYNELNRSRMLP